MKHFKAPIILLSMACFALSTSCGKKSKSHRVAPAAPYSYYQPNTACKELMTSNRILSSSALRSLANECDIVTVTDHISAAQANLHLTDDDIDIDIDIDAFKDSYIRTLSQVSRTIEGDELDKLYQSALANAKAEIKSALPDFKSDVRDRIKNVAGTVLPELLQWADKFGVDQYQGYVERKVVEKVEAESDKVIDYGFEILSKHLDKLGKIDSPEKAIASFLPMADLSVESWQLDRVTTHPYLESLKVQNVSSEDLIRIAARTYKILKDASDKGQSLEDLIRERATHAVSSPEQLAEAIKSARVAYQDIVAIAENKDKILKQAREQGKIIQENLAQVKKIFDTGFGDAQYQAIKDDLKSAEDGLKDLASSPFTDSLLGKHDKANVLKFAQNLELADFTYDIIEGKVEINEQSKQFAFALADKLLPADKREEFKKALNVAEASFQAFKNFKADDYGSLSKGVIDIAAKSGLLGKGKNAETASKVLNAAAGLAVSYFTGNPMGAISSVSSLFGGGGGGDAAGASQHAEVMESLGQINKGIADLQKVQQAVFEQTVEIRKGQQQIRQDIQDSTKKIIQAMQDGQTQLFKGQETILEGVQALARGQIEIRQLIQDQMTQLRSETARDHVEILKFLTNIQGNINRLAGGIGAILKSDLSTCQVIQLEKMRKGNGYVNAQGEFLSHQTFEAFYDKNQALFATCLKTLQSQVLFVDSSASSDKKIFFPPLTKVSFTGAFNYTEQYTLTYNYLRERKSLIPNLYALSYPVNSRQEIDSKRKVIVGPPAKAEQYQQILDSLDPQGGLNIANPEGVIYLVEQLLQSHTYFEMMGSDFKPLSRIQLLQNSPSSFNKIGYEKLKNEALPMLTATLAQRQLLRGDSILPLVADKSCPANPADFFRLLYTNRVLANNLISYMTTGDFQSFTVCGVFISYNITSFTVNQPNPNETLATFFLDIPAHKGFLRPDPVTDRLVNLKEKVIQEIAGYQFAAELSQSNLAIFKGVVFNSLTLNQIRK